jgi:hypothetical protein
MLRPSPRRSFYVVVSRTGDDQNSWYWEIRRKRRPMGVRLWECGFRSYSAAQQAGKYALEDFLNGLSMEAGSNSLSRGHSRALKRRNTI